MRKIYKSIVVSSILASSLFTAIPMTLAQTNPTSKDEPTVLFDRSHAQTAGAADWTSVGAFLIMLIHLNHRVIKLKTLMAKPISMNKH